MPDVYEPEKKPGKKHFITEKIVKQPLTRKQLARRCGFLLLAAVLFGGAAGASFAFVQPWASKHFGETAPTGPMISIPKDEPTEASAETGTAPESEAETSESRTETSTEETVAESKTASESEQIEKTVRTAIENYRYTVEDLNALFSSLRQRMQKVSGGIVVVRSVQREVDWFDNPVETTGSYAGAVIASTAQELLVLTPDAAVEQADSIIVTFADGSEVSGRMKQQDTLSGMAIVSVNVSDIGESTMNGVEPLVLGNSYLVREGDLLVAVGSPAGFVRSIDYGFVSYIMKNVQTVDQITRVFYARVSSDAGKGTFLINTSGELIGWAMEQDQETEDSGMTRVMGISDYKGILENLTNGLAAPCFGIVGQEVSDAMADQGLPHGIYVLNSVTDRPAYTAGIQNGDIITHVEDREIMTMKDFQNTVDNLECGRLVHVTVQRNGRDQYAQLEFQVTVGAR